MTDVLTSIQRILDKPDDEDCDGLLRDALRLSLLQHPDMGEDDQDTLYDCIWTLIGRYIESPRCKRAHAAETNGSLLLRNTEVAARISEILRRGAERAEITVEQVLRELAKLGFSCIGKAVTWRNEMIRQEDEDALPTMVLLPRVQIVPTEELDKATLDAIAEVSQNANGSLRIKMHDKHAALVSIGKHLGMFTDIVQMKAVYGVSDKPMSAEEWKKQYVKEG